MLRIQNRPKRALQSGPILATSPPHAQAREGAGWPAKTPRLARNRHGGLQWAGCGPIWFPIPPQSAAGRGPAYLCMGLFAIFCPGPGREAMMAGNDLKVAAAAVIGLLLVRTFPGPTGSR